MQKKITHNLEETQQLAKEFAKQLTGGDVVLLYGDLGAGKTTFVQGLAVGLGIQRRIISPTFVIVRTYDLPNNRSFYHADLYRIEHLKQVELTGIFDIMGENDSIIAIEWAEKLGNRIPQKRWEVHAIYLGDEIREITLKHIV